MLLALLLALPASAQTPEAATLPGLDYVAARQYTPDPSAIIAPDEPGLFILSARVYAFDTEEHASTGWESTVESTAIESEVPTGSDKVTFEEEEIDDLGDRAWVTILAAETPDGETGHFRMIYIQEGTMLYTVSAIAGSEDGTAIADDLAREMVDREPGDGEEAFSRDGTSTGGVWDLLPATGDDVLDGIIGFADSEHRPAE